MVESLWIRLTSPITAVIGGTWEGMKKRPSLNPFSEAFDTGSKLKLGIGAIVVILAIIAFIYIATVGLTAAASMKTSYKTLRGK